MTSLSPENRDLFLDAVRPPDGYRFDCGLGTTFTLDLMALLITPFSLALLEVKDINQAIHDPVILLESLQEYAGRLTIFCQAGRIAIPAQHNPLYRFLEEMVVEVQAPRGGVFHPKVWVFRYVQDDGPPLYRFLCLSRNLTFDNSWDLMLSLEGPLTGRQRAYSRNNPLGAFIEALPELALNPESVPERRQGQIDRLQHEIRRVDFALPYRLGEKLAFHPSGIPGYFRGFRVPQYFDRTLIISPFLSDRYLQRATRKGGDHVLVSRMDSLDDLKPATLKKFSKIYTLNEGAKEEIEGEEVEETGSEAPGRRADLHGLHAKFLAFNRGWRTTWLVGSANATNAAFISDHQRNVEFMVELEGYRSRVGVDQVLGDEEDELSLRSLLDPYERPEHAVEVDRDALAAEKRADQVRAALLNVGLRIEVEGLADDLYALRLRVGEPINLPPEVDCEIRCWPVNLPAEHQKMFNVEEGQLVFDDLSMLALTPFMAFEILANSGDAQHTLRFVLNLPIAGLPASRDDVVVSAIVENKSKFLRFLRFILAEDERLLTDPGLWMAQDQADGASHAFDEEMPLLEELVRALSRSPEKIARINRLVERLQRTTQGREALPEGFARLWESVLNTRRHEDAT